MEKNEIRKKIRDLKSMLLEKERQSAAEDVFRRVENTAAFMVAERILMYHSLPDELSTRAFLTKWSNRKRFYLPRVNGVNLEILPYDETRLELGAFHIEEPTGNDVVNPDDIDLIIVPGVAYDNRGNRIGRGKGFYDRLLRSMRATKIGVGYEFQIVSEIQAESHDVKMDMVISPGACMIVNPAVKKIYRNK
ncbi:MAG: 5-formyltetrahydrofolate cyclo-ligase [Muribaculaceae bacterium]|nr:5-formyltetrahydrofolate cyclo-ligase [Muribaculaceae bacterium]